MAANKLTVITVQLPTAIGNLCSPPTAVTGGVAVPNGISNAYYILRKMRVTNNSAATVAFALWRQVTFSVTPVAGKEFVWGGLAAAAVLTAGTGQIIPAQGQVEWSGSARLDSRENDAFLVGGMTSTATAGSLTLEIEFEIGFV